jgi:HK97 family phage prohead protease
MADALELLRTDALRKRIHGIAGGNHILWGEKDLVDIHNHTLSLKMEQIVQRPAETKLHAAPLVDKDSLTKIGIVLRDFNPDDLAFLALITNATVDHVRDSVNPRGVDDSLFAKNAPVLDSHDSSKPPVATSGRTFMSGENRLAIFRFPKPGVSANSDQTAAAVRARLLRGVSIGFIPLKWSFTKDPSRPMGVDFHEIRLLEFSTCSVPANPDCYVLGLGRKQPSFPGRCQDGQPSARSSRARR